MRGGYCGVRGGGAWSKGGRGGREKDEGERGGGGGGGEPAGEATTISLHGSWERPVADTTEDSG